LATGINAVFCRRAQELVEAATLYAERGAQAEYEVFAVLSAMVPPQVLSFVFLCHDLPKGFLHTAARGPSSCLLWPGGQHRQHRQKRPSCA